jgi:hypothetical protein
MTSKIQIKPLQDGYLPYQEIQTSTSDPSLINKDNFSEENYDDVDLKIEMDKIVKQHELTGDIRIHIFPKLIGNLRVFKFDKNGDPSIAIGPHWPFYICLTTTIFFIFFLFMYFVWDYLDISIKIVGMIMYLIQFLSYTYVFLKNPGIPKNFLKSQAKISIEKVEVGFKYCNRCNIMISSMIKTNHCHDCNVCIVGKIN